MAPRTTSGKKGIYSYILGGDRGLWNSRLPYLLLPLPALFRRGSRFFALFLLYNVMLYCDIFLLFSRLPPLYESCLPPSHLLPPIPLPPPILPGFQPPVPLHYTIAFKNNSRQLSLKYSVNVKFTLLFSVGRQIIAQRFITHVQSCYFAH